jgi:hypothetical protein
MNGARILPNSLSGTLPAKTSDSVPRLIALKIVFTRTSASSGGVNISCRISALPCPQYQREKAVSELAVAAIFFNLGLELPMACRVIQ